MAGFLGTTALDPAAVTIKRGRHKGRNWWLEEREITNPIRPLG
jgi:hypothetical protein